MNHWKLIATSILEHKNLNAGWLLRWYFRSGDYKAEVRGLRDGIRDTSGERVGGASLHEVMYSLSAARF
jgi:hypothetical protein